MIRFFTLLLFLLSSWGTYAQTNVFEKGYILQNQDTILGYISAAPDVELSRSIKFKSSPSQENFTVYSPEEISGFGFNSNGFYFTTVTVEIISGASREQKIRFAKQLLSGFTNLYKLQLPEEEQFIVFSRNNTFVYVLRKSGIDHTLGYYETRLESGVRKDKRYIGMLRAALMDCDNQDFSKEFNRLDNLKFDDKSIIDLVTSYNSCKSPALQTTVHQHKSKPVLKHGAEASFAWLYIPNNSNNYSGRGASVGYFWDILQPDLSRKISTRIGINYLYFKQEAEYRFSQKNERTLHFVRVPVSGQFNLKDPFVSSSIPFFNIGLTAQATKHQNGYDFIPFPHIGLGMYSSRFRYAVLMENDGFGVSNAKILNFSLGIRLD